MSSLYDIASLSIDILSAQSLSVIKSTDVYLTNSILVGFQNSGSRRAFFI